MDNTQAQIQVGASHQARLPPLQLDVKPEDMPECCENLETLVWQPDAIVDGDLLMYLRAARSMAAFVGWCDGGSTDDGCAAASMDETTINSLHMLHQHAYDTGQALQALVKVINPKSVDKRWSDEDAKKYVRGLKQHGKNFFKIRRDLLTNKETAQLVEYYYLWKKTPAASTTRPHRRHRRPALRRQAPTPTLPSSEYLEDLSSASEGSENESDEESDQSSTTACYNCRATKSSRWFKVGKDKRIVCTDCHKYGDGGGGGGGGRGGEGATEEQADPPPFMFRPVKEEDLDKLGSDGKEGSSCPETSDEGRGAEERTSPSIDSTCSSISSLAKEIPPNLAAAATEKAKKLRLDGHGRNDRHKTSSPSGSYTSSVYGGEDNEQDGDVENNQDEVSSHASSNVASPVDAAFAKSAPVTVNTTDPSLLPPHSTPSGTTFSSEAPAPWMRPSTGTDQTMGKSLIDMIDQKENVDDAMASVRHIVGDRPWFCLPTDKVGVGAQRAASASSLIKREQDMDLSASKHPIGATLAENRDEWRAKLEPSEDSERTDSTRHLPVFVPQSGSAWTSIVGVGDGKGHDDTKPHRAVASVAPTPVFTKHDPLMSSALHYPLQPPPSLIPVGSTVPPPFSRDSIGGLDDRGEGGVGGGRRGVGDTPPPMLHLSAMHGMVEGGAHFRTGTSPGLLKLPVSSAGLGGGAQVLADMRRSPLSMMNSGAAGSDGAGIRSRSRSPHNTYATDSDGEMMIMRRSPSPEPRVIHEECYRKENFLLIKRWMRGYNSCARSDIEFQPAPGSSLAQKREKGLTRGSSSHGGHSGSKSSSSSHKESRNRSERKDDDDKKKPTSPPENCSSDAQITSSLLGGTHNLPPGYGGAERLTPRGGPYMGHDPTPALTTLSAYAKPHNLGSGSSRELQRCLPYNLPPPPQHAIDQYFRMPGVYPPPPGSRIDMEMERERDKRERDAWEREIREIEFMEKMKQEMDLKPPGFDRSMLHMGAGGAGSSLDPVWVDYQRRFGPLALSAPGQGGPLPGHMPGVYPPGNLTADLLLRERERIEMTVRSSQEQQMAAAAAANRDNGAVYQLYQRYAHDPVMLQRQLNAYMMMSASKAHDSEVARMIEASHLVYHFARADPLASAGSSSTQGSSGGLPPHSIPPPPHQGAHPLIAVAREQERIYMELLSRPPYSTDPVLAQQLTVQAAQQQEAFQRQLAMERECLGAPPGSMMLH